jgi:hypothetical protein
MPISCAAGATALTGSDGLVLLAPAGTSACLQDFTDFPAGTDIKVPVDSDFRVHDPVVFTTENNGMIPAGLTPGTVYYVTASTPGTISVSATKGGAAIAVGPGGGSAIASIAAATPGVGYTAGTYTNVAIVQGANRTAKATVVVPAGGALAATAITITDKGTGYTAAAGSLTLAGGDNGSGAALDAVAPTTPFSGTATLSTAITGNTAGHINVAYSLTEALCGVKEWSLELSRDSIDVTTLPCKLGTASRYAGFKSSLGGFVSGEGSMTVMFTRGRSQINRVLANSLYKNSTAKVKFYLEASVDTAGKLDDSTSNYIEATVSLQGFSTGANVDDALECEIQFSLLGTPDALFGVAL